MKPLRRSNGNIARLPKALRDLGPGSLNDKLGGDCGAFARLLNALARASRETMLLQKYREAVAQARAALQPMMDPKRKLTDEERHALVQQVNEILGLDQYEHDFEHQTPATGIIRLDKVSPHPEGPVPGGNSKSETRNSEEVRNSNSEGDPDCDLRETRGNGPDQTPNLTQPAGDPVPDPALQNSTAPSLPSPVQNPDPPEQNENIA